MKQLDQLCAVVRRWNATIRLVSPRDCAALESRHVANCMTLIPLIEQLRPRTVIDLGSGAGFPGLVIAIVTGLPVHLVESDLRKAAFLREATRQLGVSAVVHAMRADMLEFTADLVTARALAPLPELWAMSRPLLTAGGTGLFLKGASAPEELRRASHSGLLWSDPAGSVVEMRT